jgi:hypothetical protein
MAISPCRECKQPVSTEAKTCPHCGIQRPIEKSLAGILFSLIGFLIIAAGISAMFPQVRDTSVQTERHADTASSTPQQTADTTSNAQQTSPSTPTEPKAKATERWIRVLGRFSYDDKSFVWYEPGFGGVNVTATASEIKPDMPSSRRLFRVNADCNLGIVAWIDPSMASGERERMAQETMRKPRLNDDYDINAILYRAICRAIN